MSKTGTTMAMKQLKDEEQEAVRKYFRLRKQIEQQERELRKRYILRHF